MSKPRANQEQLKAQKKERKRVQKRLREELIDKGFTLRSHATISNHKCEYNSVEEERTARNDALSDQIQLFRA